MTTGQPTWGIGGGAFEQPEVGRLLAWATIRGVEGVFAPPDFQVQALATPGTAVRIARGGCGILSRALGAYQQAYLNYRSTEDTLNVPASSGSARSHLVVRRVENPNISGEPWQEPEDPANDDYTFNRLLTDVPNTTKTVTELNLGYSAIPLARLDVPSSTSTITAGMVIDLRKVTGIGDVATTPVVVVPGTDDPDPLGTNATAYFPWPFNATVNVPVPTWATVADVDVEIQNVRVVSGSISGMVRIVVNGVAGPEVPWSAVHPGATVLVTIPLHYVNLPVPANIRGITVPAHIEARALAGLLGNGQLQPSASSVIKFAWHFKQAPTTA